MSRYEYERITWFAADKQGLQKLYNPEFKGSELRVLMYLLSIINSDNRAIINSQIDIANKLMLSERIVSKSFQKLIKKNLIVKENNTTFFINPLNFWTGNNTIQYRKTQEFTNLVNRSNT